MFIIRGKTKSLGEFQVSRVLPQITHKNVGPFVFFDHLSKAKFPPGAGLDVRPHPHIGLSTVTYLFDGAMLHRDSLGNEVEIKPGEINLMTAGKGIVHSERTPAKLKESGFSVEALQLWLTLPKEKQDMDPEFFNIKESELPKWKEGNVEWKLLIGQLKGKHSPVPTYMPTLYAICEGKDYGEIEFTPDMAEELAVYVLSGKIHVEEHQTISAGEMLILEKEKITAEFHKPMKLAIVGGKKLDFAPIVWWNFVSSSMERIEQAKADWKDRKFPVVPGDEKEYIPLP